MGYVDLWLQMFSLLSSACFPVARLLTLSSAMAAGGNAQAWLEREIHQSQMRRWTRAYPEAKATLTEIAQGLTSVAGTRNLRTKNPDDREILVIPLHKFLHFIKVVEEVENPLNYQ